MITIEEGLATLTPIERNLWDALCCPDLVADVKVKWSKDLMKTRRRKAANRTPEIEERMSEASKRTHDFGAAMNPDTVHAMMRALMAARVERDRLKVDE